MPKRSRAGFYKKINTELNKNLSLLSQEFINEERINDVISTDMINEIINKDITETVPLSTCDNIIEENVKKDISENDSYVIQDVSVLWNEQLVNKNDIASISGSSFKNHLKNWALKHKIHHLAISDLLKLLKTSDIDPNALPSDARTLLSTPGTLEIQEMDPGTYYHFGLFEAIKRLYKDDGSNTIELLINIDGLPLSKSSSSQIYPILCSLYSNPRKVTSVGIYHGYAKPANANELLLQFVNEAIDRTVNGININGNIKQLKIKGFICDAPAKSFICYIKGHTGFYSCTKCFQKGTYLKGRTCFPKTNCKKRTAHIYISALFYDQMEEIFGRQSNAVGICVRSSILPSNNSEASTLKKQCVSQSDNKSSTSTSSDIELSINSSKKRNRPQHGSGSNKAKTKVELEKQWSLYLHNKENRDSLKDEKLAKLDESKREMVKLRKRQLALREKEFEYRKETAANKRIERTNRHAEIIEMERQKCELLKKLIRNKNLQHTSDSD